MAARLVTRRPLSLLAAATASVPGTGSSSAQPLLATARRTLRTATHASLPRQPARLIVASSTSRRSFSHSASARKPPSPAPAVSSTSSAPPPSPPAGSTSTTLTRTPTAPEEPAVLQNGAPSITLLERGSSRLDEIAQKEGLEGVALRVEVMPGGCHGYQYAMSVEETFEGEEDDFRFTSTTHPRAHLLIDSVSLRLLKGATIDYATELIGSQFVVKDNPQSKGAGCGCGVSWEPVEGAL